MNSIRTMILRALISGELEANAAVFELLNRLALPARDRALAEEEGQPPRPADDLTQS